MLVLSVFLIIFIGCSGYNKELRIGGLFCEDNEEIAFRLAANTANERYPSAYFSLIPHTKRIDPTNSLYTYRAICNLLDFGVIGIFGPSSSLSSRYIQAISDRKEIPHIETHYSSKPLKNDCLVNLHPHPGFLSQAFVEIIQSREWINFTILYDDYESFFHTSQLIALNSDQDRRRVRLRKLQPDPGGSGNYRPVLNQAKNTGHTRFILDCHKDILLDVLFQAQQVGMMSERYHYLITNMDLQTLNLTPFRYGGTNITGIRLISPNDTEVKSFANKLREVRLMYGKDVADEEEHVDSTITVQVALLYDAVLLLHKTLRYIDTAKKLYIDPGGMSCNTSSNWVFGYTIINYMRRLSLNGLTGPIKFDYEGYRTSFNLGIIELYEDGLKQVGSWNHKSGLISTRKYKPVVLADEQSLFHTTFSIITCLTPPYGMLKETTVPLDGNDRYEGYAIDLIEELSLMLGFNYTFKIQEDGANGNYDQYTGKWNGMIKRVMDEEVDLAITDLTITSERESVVDFTMPFMNLGISILYRKPEPAPPSLFMFISPFSSMVWFMLGVAYFLVSIAIFVMGRLSYSEWTNPYPCIEQPEYLVNQFSIRNCLWFTLGSLMQQGSEIAPIGVSTRTAAGVWWFFILIMVSSYTANLAAFLTVEMPVSPFKNIEELVKHKEIRYGAKKNGATANFFRDSNVSTYKQIWDYILSHPEDMTADNDEGVQKVETENYAYLMESSSIEYVTERHCTLAMIGSWLDDKGYGIAMKKGSPYRKALSEAILKLQETGKLTKLKIKWWKEKRGGGNCASKPSSSEATPLDLKNVGGVFLVLFVGTILGLIAGFIEMTLFIYRQATKHKLSFKRELINELKFIFNIRQFTKVVENRDTDNIEKELIE